MLCSAIGPPCQPRQTQVLYPRNVCGPARVNPFYEYQRWQSVTASGRGNPHPTAPHYARADHFLRSATATVPLFQGFQRDVRHRSIKGKILRGERQCFIWPGATVPQSFKVAPLAQIMHVAQQECYFGASRYGGASEEVTASWRMAKTRVQSISDTGISMVLGNGMFSDTG